MPQEIIKKLSTIFLISLFMYLTTNTANAYLVHILGHDLYGDYSISISLIFSLTPLLSLGSLKSITKLLPVFLKQDNNKANLFIKWSIGLLIKSCLLITILISLLYITKHTLHSSLCRLNDCEKYSHLFFDILFVAPLSLTAIWLNRFLNANQHVDAAKIFNTPSLVYFSAFILFIFTLINDTIGNTDLIAVIFIGFFMLSFCQMAVILFTTNHPGFSLQSITKAKIQKKDRDFFLQNSLGMMMNSMLYIALGIESLLLLEWLAPTEAAVGYYVIIVKVGALSGLVGLSLSYLLNPCYSNLKDRSRLLQLQKLLTANALIGLIWLVISLISFLSLKPWIFKYYSIDFPHATPVIIGLLIFNYLASALRKYETISLYNDLNKPLMVITIMQFIITAFFCILLIPSFSYVGAIMSQIISEVFCFLATMRLVKRKKIHIKVFGVF